ncbi:hypothetical protein MAPG_01946 [Magnaporthiopsis poae ATCC 64411]|uniref:Rhodopsin domain-containing protein n=1 Tax=Magnaporthiopsis poae (strain ATCC 64411 / 73-15) TaxID=644358 RepID=A0A0C4DQ12_MAGP6|nr:hypothetical protein MAPG_01946 [Magnaporthiopsis poae ATCC 64411]
MNQGGRLDQFLARDPTFPGELWTWFCIGTTVMILRFGVRLRMAGIVGLAADDYFMVLTFVFHAALIALGLLIYQYGTNVDLGQSDVDQLSEGEIVQLMEGSKYLQASWYIYTCFLWCIKACALSFYRRLTFSLWQHTLVFKTLCWVTFLSFVAVILVVSLSCLPYEDNFLVRHLPPPECLFQKQNLVSVVVLNVFTDSAILILPIPVLRDLRLPWFKKLVICLLVCSGFFVITAAAIRLAATLDAAPSAVTIAIRHSSAADSPNETPRRHQRRQRQQQQEWEFQQYTGRGQLDTGEGSSSRPDREGDTEKSQERGGGGGNVVGLAVPDVSLVEQSGPSSLQPVDIDMAGECVVAESAEDRMEKRLPVTRSFYGVDDDNRREKSRRGC